jgi:hypothetical protein
LLEAQSDYEASFPESLIDYKWNKETQKSAGSLVLHDFLMTSYNHGRTKKREVLLFQHKLLFLRNKGSLKMVVWDISLRKDVLQIAYSPKDLLQLADDDAGSLTVYWKTKMDGEPRVSGVHIYFEESWCLGLWAAFLALDPKPPPEVSAGVLTEMQDRNRIQVLTMRIL